MSATIGLFYGSTTGNTDDVAQQLLELLSEYDVELHDVADSDLSLLASYEYLILGIPTWDFGELQEDWLDQWGQLDSLAMAGKHCALFGLGDQIGYGEWFLDAMGLLHDQLQQRGATMVGYWPVDGYKFEASKALTSDSKQFVGLALDEDTQHIDTAERLEQWAAQILAEFGLVEAGS